MKHRNSKGYHTFPTSATNTDVVYRIASQF